MVEIGHTKVKFLKENNFLCPSIMHLSYFISELEMYDHSFCCYITIVAIVNRIECNTEFTNSTISF